jgi:hypothetical protein
MAETVIRVENLGKKYVIGHQKQERYTALRDVLVEKARALGQIFSRNGHREDPTHEEFWALKDVSFEVKQGDLARDPLRGAGGHYWPQWGGEVHVIEDFESDYGADGGPYFN